MRRWGKKGYFLVFVLFFVCVFVWGRGGLGVHGCPPIVKSDASCSDRVVLLPRVCERNESTWSAALRTSSWEEGTVTSNASPFG